MGISLELADSFLTGLRGWLLSCVAFAKRLYRTVSNFIAAEGPDKGCGRRDEDTKCPEGVPWARVADSGLWT